MWIAATNFHNQWHSIYLLYDYMKITWKVIQNSITRMEKKKNKTLPAPGYPIASKHPSLPSRTAGITSDKAEAHTSTWFQKRKKVKVNIFTVICDVYFH